MRLVSSLVVAGVLAATASAQFSLVVPNGYAAVEPAGANAFPFGNAIAPTWPGLRVLHIYDSTHFSSQGVNYPIIITGLRWRAADAATTTSWTGGTYSLGTIQMSTAPVDHTGATATSWGANHGPDLTTVYSGPITVNPGSGNGLNVPGPYHVGVTFPPFLYDPNAGDLTIDCDVASGTWSGGSLSALSSLTTANTTPPALARRVYASTLYPNPNAADSNILVCEITYSPSAGLYSSFTASPRAGIAPLSVNFTDTTFTSDPAGITSWAWDFNGDNVIDSTLQNPSYIYTTCGDFNVTLTTTDATHPPSTVTRSAYIKTDEIVAGFTYALLAPPNVFQFTDTTTPAATAWDWDFNGDNITDSTSQNPVWVFPLCQAQTVRLIATRNCRSSTRSQNIFIAANTLSTLFTGGNSGAAGWTVYFDVNVTNPQGVNICGLATNSITAANTAFSMDAYITPGTYVGNEVTPAAWHSAGSAVGVTAGANTPSLAGFATPFYIPFGSYGLALRYIGAAPAYTNGPLGPYSNADMTLTLGVSRATTAPFTGGTNFFPRVWNGSLFYDTAQTTSIAGYGFFGAGCAGSMGVPRLVNSGRPQFGTSLSVTITNVPASAAIMMTGFSNTTSVFGPLPVDTTPYGAPGCLGRVSTEAVLFLAGAANSVVWSFPIPSDPSMAGVQMYNQAISLDPGFNALGATLSDAHAMLIGY